MFKFFFLVHFWGNSAQKEKKVNTPNEAKQKCFYLLRGLNSFWNYCITVAKRIVYYRKQLFEHPQALTFFRFFFRYFQATETVKGARMITFMDMKILEIVKSQ